MRHLSSVAIYLTIVEMQALTPAKAFAQENAFFNMPRVSLQFSKHFVILLSFFPYQLRHEHVLSLFAYKILLAMHLWTTAEMLVPHLNTSYFICQEGKLLIPPIRINANLWNMHLSLRRM